MQPDIMTIVSEYNLEINPRTANKIQVEAKCPFCHGDANKRRKYKFSINAEMHVFRCWLCNASGYVYDLEAHLSNKPYEEVRKKYTKRKLRKAEKLSPKQLEKIEKRHLKVDYEAFKQQFTQIEKEWDDYCLGQKRLLLSKILLGHVLNLDMMSAIYAQVESSEVPNLYSEVIHEYLHIEITKKSWAIEARASVKSLLQDYQSENEHTLVAVLLIRHYKQVGRLQQ
ncbi:hypothetical protein [Geomicrobium sediminis]|uniref:Rubredoxin n=1 Tax=Geomicrobium sediminis TaxID=1347788 RepID=A0ABS2PFL7_9BACL|nr:hypothetical protein [Geomicrobium sediminis]MBM7634200.1 rubredoxin [Geomicrobium sediminis]